MPARLFRGLMVTGVSVLLAGTVWADPPTFGELLVHAQAQAASGHRWGPPGDNMTETVASMMGLISSATPRQLSELSALLESDTSHPSEAAEAPPAAPPDQTPAATPAAESAPPPSSVATAEPSGPDTSAAPIPPRPVTADSVEPPAPAPVVTAAAAPDRAVATPAPMPAPEVQASIEPDRQEEEPTGPSQPPAPPPTAARDRAITEQDRLLAKSAEPAPTPRAPTAASPGARAAEMFARGQEAERLGDVSGARRFYAIAVQRGNATAARNLGRLYDPAYLKQTTMGGIDPDPALARHWYERAVAMGDPVAGPLLEALALR